MNTRALVRTKLLKRDVHAVYALFLYCMLPSFSLDSAETALPVQSGNVRTVRASMAPHSAHHRQVQRPYTHKADGQLDYSGEKSHGSGQRRRLPAPVKAGGHCGTPEPHLPRLRP